MFDFNSLGLNDVSTLADIGAGLGTFLRPAIDYYQPKQWIAVEMLPDRAELLRNNFTGGIVTNCAVGEHPSTATIRRTVSADSSSLLVIDPRSQDWFSTGPKGMDQAEDGKISVCTLDELCESLETIDLMKMDVQGYEARAIRGGKETLKRTHALIIEILFVHHYDGQSEEAEINSELEALGFKLNRWLEKNYNNGILLQGDAFYVNANL